MYVIHHVNFTSINVKVLPRGWEKHCYNRPEIQSTKTPEKAAELPDDLQLLKRSGLASLGKHRPQTLRTAHQPGT